MGEPEFTESPWKVNTTEDELWGDDVWYLVEYHSVIAKDERIASDISSKANAALIAAAPDMYAMLEAIAKEMGDCRILLRGQSIQDLLAKARGEE